MTKIIALFNQAGGVGKTTLAQNLGYHLHLRNQRVLLIDLDPQASLTTFMGIETESLDSTPFCHEFSNVLLTLRCCEVVNPVWTKLLITPLFALLSLPST